MPKAMPASTQILHCIFVKDAHQLQHDGHVLREEIASSMTLFRSLADDLPPMDWLHQHITLPLPYSPAAVPTLCASDSISRT